MQKTGKDRVDILNEIAEAERHLFEHVCTHAGCLKPGIPPVIGERINRKDYPITTGVLDYFPDALLEVARVSKVGNEQQNPGTVMHWDKAKSTDEADALVRHLLRRGTNDKDGLRHTAKVAWRALALLQREIEAEHKEGRI